LYLTFVYMVKFTILRCNCEGTLNREYTSTTYYIMLYSSIAAVHSIIFIINNNMNKLIVNIYDVHYLLCLSILNKLLIIKFVIYFMSCFTTVCKSFWFKIQNDQCDCYVST
jgi:hypothetical protein